jgi:hypothetical protein
MELCSEGTPYLELGRGIWGVRLGLADIILRGNVAVFVSEIVREREQQNDGVLDSEYIQGICGEDERFIECCT